jgi:hypothetical protein
MVLCACHPGNLGSINSRLKIWAGLSIFQKNNQSKKGWAFGSSDRVPTYQVQGPELKFQYCQKKKKKMNPT